MDRLENMRRNALGRNASQCLLCGDTFGMLGAQKVICVDCRRLACQKCAIETHTMRTTCSPSKGYWLCMICAETREIWKKSGAWFFKSLPKYILPTETHSFGKHRSIRMSRGGKGHREEDSSSDEERRMWNKVQRRHSSTESMHGGWKSVIYYYRVTIEFDRFLNKLCSVIILCNIKRDMLNSHINTNISALYQLVFSVFYSSVTITYAVPQICKINRTRILFIRPVLGKFAQHNSVCVYFLSC